MKKLWPILVLLGVVAIGALDDMSVPYTFGASDTIYAAYFNANNDSLEAWIIRTNDSLDLKWIRFTDLNGHDTTLKYLAVDTIRSKPDVDSIRGRPWIDSSDIDYLDVTDSLKVGNDLNVTGEASVGGTLGITGRTTATNITADTITCDSIKNSSGISTVRLTATGNITGDSLVSSKGARITNHVACATLTGSGNVTGDSLVSTKGTRVANSLKVGGDVYTVAWAEFTTPTIVGVTDSSSSIYYKKIGNLVFVNFAVAGTGSTTAFTFTVPYTNGGGIYVYFPIAFIDNSTAGTAWGRGQLNNGSSTVTLYTNAASAGWTASGSRSAVGQFFFEAQ